MKASGLCCRQQPQSRGPSPMSTSHQPVGRVQLDAPVGAAWYRTYTGASHGYGFVNEVIPELSIAVMASHRHEGIGRRLLVDLINASDSQGHAALSLSVAEKNPARRLYESVGFIPVETHGSSW